MTKTRNIVMALICAAGVAGCTDSKNRIAFDGKYFRAKVSKVDKQRDVFTVRIKDVAQSLEGARAAALYESNKYCVSTYGSSDISWVVGPDTPDDQLGIVDNTLTYQGTCPQAQ